MKKGLIFKQFIKNPSGIGALCPSSAGLCREMINGINIEAAEAVAELGPGTGVITSEIVNAVNMQCKFFAVELDQCIFGELTKTWPDVNIINDSAENLGKIMEQHKIKRLDAVISGLPWAAFPVSLQTNIMDEVINNLASGGYFTTFAYIQGMLLPAGRRFRRLLNEKFTSVQTSRVIWANLPPAFVYRCRK